MLTERYSKHAFAIDLANRSATNRIKRDQNVQIVNRVETIEKQKETKRKKKSHNDSVYLIQSWPRHKESERLRDIETYVELKIGYFIK